MDVELNDGQQQQHHDLTCTVVNDSAKSFGMSIDVRRRVTQMADDGLACKAGVRIGDTVLTFNGKGIESEGDLFKAMRKCKHSETATFEVRRAGSGAGHGGASASSTRAPVSVPKQSNAEECKECLQGLAQCICCLGISVVAVAMLAGPFIYMGIAAALTDEPSPPPLPPLSPPSIPPLE